MPRAHIPDEDHMLWRPRRHLGRPHHALTSQTFFFGGLKCHLKGLDIMLEGLEVVMRTHGTFWKKEVLRQDEKERIEDTWLLEA
jgi:G:T-mismatch repair DNA endonuclease (very short patch repair protein)